MKASRWLWTLWCTPALAALLTISGCSNDSKPKDSPKSSSTPSAKAPAETKAAPTASTGSKTPVEGQGEATLKGKVVYDGTPPERTEIASIDQNSDKDVCHKGDTKSQEWIVGPDKGVANVVVWVKPPPGKFFKVPDAMQARTDKVSIDQPQCAFIPHVAAINPSFYDPATKKQKKTGQVLEVKNSAPIKHNTGYSGNRLINAGDSKIIGSGTSIPIDAKPCKDTDAGGEDLLALSCDIHKWMTGKVAVFDHPFYAVTNNKGEFEIKGIPAGSEVELAYWHESMDPASLKAAKKETVTLKAGENVKELKVKK